MMKHIPIIIVLSLLFIGNAFGQTRKAYIKAADEAMIKRNYYEALTFYNEALEFDKDNPEILYKSAEAARLFDAFEMSESRYATLLDTISSTQFPEAYLGMGKVLKAQGKYKEAKTYLETFLEKYSELDEESKMDAQDVLKTVTWAMDREEEIDKSAEIERLGDNVNSPESDFGTAIYDSTLYYTTMKYEESDTDRDIPRSISKIHTYKNGEAQLIDGELNEGNSLKAHPTITNDGKWMFYTICEYDLQNKLLCDIYKREIIGELEYGEKIKLSSDINMEGSTTTQPHIAYDQNNEREVLYFVSNRDGGKGGYDIYYSVLNSQGDLSIPVPAKINTEDDEVSPYYNGLENKLYFASNGRLGLGGFDIYSYSFNVPDAEPEHLRAPVNSSYDDLYYVWDEERGISYFSSNRAASMKLDDVTNACCFDIYEVRYNKVVIDLLALTYDSLTRSELHGATLYLIDKNTGDTIDIVENLDGNNHEFVLKRDKQYQIIAKREHYDDFTMDLSTSDITESGTIEKKIYMYTPKTQINVLTFDNKTKEELVGTRLIVRNTTDDTFTSIDIENLESNHYHLYLNNGHRYDIKVSKFGYVEKADNIDLSGYTKPQILEKKVYLDVFEIEEYRDTDVYFENDYPNPKSIETSTNVVYGDHFIEYIDNKSEYIRKVRKSRSIKDKENAIQDLDAFFEGDVAGGYEMFKRFMRALKKELSLGRKLVVELKGYASPVADSKYNRALSSRRVNSVKNEMMRYDGGVLRDYLKRGQLVINDVSYGDELAPPDVSDSQVNVIASVYSVKAAKERRVEIIRIKDQ